MSELLSELTWFCMASICSFVTLEELQPAAATIVNNTIDSRTMTDLLFNFNLLLTLPYDQYRGVVLGMLDSGLIDN